MFVLIEIERRKLSVFKGTSSLMIVSCHLSLDETNCFIDYKLLSHRG